MPWEDEFAFGLELIVDGLTQALQRELSEEKVSAATDERRSTSLRLSCRVGGLVGDPARWSVIWYAQALTSITTLDTAFAHAGGPATAIFLGSTWLISERPR